MLATQVRPSGNKPLARFRLVDHPSFHDSTAAVLYGTRADDRRDAPVTTGHFSDDITRDLAKRMHYAAFRLAGVRNGATAQTWRDRYFDLREKIILGNRKLVYRAVQKRVRDPQLFEDSAAECQLVIIRAIACYDPWLGIRFSTYAFTCLLRELNRLVQKQAKDRLRHAASFNDFLIDDLPLTEVNDKEPEDSSANLRRFFASGNALLSDREKEVLCQRFGIKSKGKTATLKDVSGELQISKERVRQSK